MICRASVAVVHSLLSGDPTMGTSLKSVSGGGKRTLFEKFHTARNIDGRGSDRGVWVVVVWGHCGIKYFAQQEDII